MSEQREARQRRDSTPLRTVALRYLISILVVLAASLIQYSATRNQQPHSQFMPFIAAVVVSAWIGGSGPALMAALLGAVLGELILAPALRFRLDQPHLVDWALYGSTALLCILTCILLERSRRSAFWAAREATAQRAISEDQAARRRSAESELSERDHELRRHQAWLLLALRAARMGCWSRGATSGAIEYSESLEELFGLPANGGTRAAGDFLARVLEEDRPMVLDAIAQATRTGAEYEIEYRIQRPDGALRWMSERGQCRFEGDDSLGRLVGVTIDISERKQIEAHGREMRAALMDYQARETERLEAERDRIRGELARQDRLATIGQLSASIAHDLRNPLGVIRNAVYLQRRRLAKLEQPLDLLSMIDTEVKSADTIITNLMEMARGRAPQTAPVDLGALVDELTRHIDSSGRISWRFQSEPSPFVISCDAEQFRQVLSNLLKNAVEAMRGKGEVWITASRADRCDSIRIRDTGTGIAHELRDKLFQSIVTSKESGTGLGLLLCRQIVQRHGGTIRLLDDLAGGGAAFEVCLPRESWPA